MIKERQRATRKDSKGRILRKGEGQDKTGRYYFVYTDLKGKRKRIYNLDLLELRQEEKELQKDIEDGIDSDTAQRTLNEQFELYLGTKKIKETTKIDYISKWNTHIHDTLGYKKLCDIKKSDIQSFYKKLSDLGLRDTTIQTYARILQPTLESAVNDDIIRKNPAKNCINEYNEPSKVKEALTIEQQENLLNFVRESYNAYYPIIAFALSTACRIGEIIGLRWNDIDLKNRTISIDHQLRYIKKDNGCEFVLNTPKSKAGVRTIPMTEKCYQALIKQREIQMMLGINHNLEVAGIKNFVFTTTAGKPYIPVAVNDALKRIVNSYNAIEIEKAKKEIREPKLLPKMSCHILRHTACTRLAECNVDIKVLQKFMGHSDIAMTMNIYNHVDSVRMKAEIEKAEQTSKVV